MTPLGELLADGMLGPAGAEALYRTVRALVVAHGYPPPEARAHWDADAVSEVAHDFLADGRTPKRLAHLAVHSVDDDGFDRLLHRIVLNFLRDGGRRTDIGRLMRRLRDVLGDSDEFVEKGDRWRLSDKPDEPSAVAPADLVRVAAEERDIEVPKWSANARRKAPVADAASLTRLCRRVLDAADGFLALDELAHAIAPRLGIQPTPIAEPHQGRDQFDTVAAPQHADDSLDSLRAGEIFEGLAPRERLLLAHPGAPVRELRDVTGLGPSQAATARGRLRALLAAELQDDDRYETVFFHLVDRARAWAARQPPGQPDAVRRLRTTT